MRKKGPHRRGITRIDLTMLFIGLLIIGVVAIPRYLRLVRIDEAKNVISRVQHAAEETVRERQHAPADAQTPRAELPDDRLISALERNLGGSLPPNPFTGSSRISLRHLPALTPCEILEREGGWVWNLVQPPHSSSPAVNQVWLNSDTFHIGDGKGEACLQP